MKRPTASSTATLLALLLTVTVNGLLLVSFLLSAPGSGGRLGVSAAPAPYPPDRDRLLDFDPALTPEQRAQLAEEERLEREEMDRLLGSFDPRLSKSQRAKLAEEARLKQEEEERIDFENARKYFHEPASHDIGADDTLGHYDTRFFKGVVPYAEKRESQVHMVRAYLDTFAKYGIETWIAHGTLLGWWWNAKMLPWDWDIDTQVSEATLYYLGRHFNATEHTYTTASHDDHDQQVTRTYLLDVNPEAIANRTWDDGFNIIDARWINTHNGLYIDITALSELEPETNPGVVSCKNFHDYNMTELYPLRDTMFEGIPTKVPFAYAKILVDEYTTKALVLTDFAGHLFEQDSQEWIKSTEGEEGDSQAD